MEILKELVSLIWLILPAASANMFASISFKLLPSFTKPLDHGVRLRGRRLFGKNKTYRGLIAGVLAGLGVFIVQRLAFDTSTTVQEISLIAYDELPILLGSLFGFGALAGDVIESFVKRQIGIAPGKPLLFFDQTDWVIGFIVATIPLQLLTLALSLKLLLVMSALHIGVKYVSYQLKIDRAPL